MKDRSAFDAKHDLDMAGGIGLTRPGDADTLNACRGFAFAFREMLRGGTAEDALRRRETDPVGGKTLK